MSLRIVLPAVLAIACFANADPGRIVVSFDDWTLSATGFNPPNEPGVLVQNTAAWFAEDSIGSFIGYGGAFHLGAQQLLDAFAAAGHSYVRSESVTLELTELQDYDGVFIGAKPMGDLPGNVGALMNYVNGGGNVYVYGGTDYYGSIAEDAAVLNSFLGSFGLECASEMIVYRGSYPLSSTHPVLTGVDLLFTDNGTAVSDLDPADESNEVLEWYGGAGVVAIYDGSLGITAVESGGRWTDRLSVQPYPNPAHNAVTILYARSADRGEDLRIYDVAGRMVRALALGTASGTATWDGTDSMGRRVSAGVYFLRLTDGVRQETARLVYVR